MKSIKFFAVASAVALLSTTGFTSCNQKNGPDEPGNYNGETVKTEFSISIPEAGSDNNGGVMRMPSSTVQKAGRTEFQGMTGITLIPFDKQIVAPAVVPIASANTRIGDNITLSDIASVDELGSSSNAIVYTNVQIPLTTASFLFYAKSKKTGEESEIGSLVTDLDKANPSEIKFNLEPIYTNDPIAASSAGSALLAYLNSVANASDGSKAWKDYTVTDDAGMQALFETYSSMHGLSSFEVARVMTDLYTSLMPISSDIATGIKTAIANETYATVNTTTGVVTLKGVISDYPQNHGLPQGAIQIAWNTTDKAFKQTDYAGDNITLPANYTYPAQLWYYVNSEIKTSNTSKKDMYDNAHTWSQIRDAHTDAKAVNSKTRAVAIYSPIQYAVARLDVAARVSGTTLADNSESATGIATAVTVPTGGFPVTAVLIGGQREVGFDFTVLDAASQEYTIYDHVMTETMFASNDAFSESTKFNSTLVLETPKVETNEVKIAVEMENTSDVDFYGVGNQLIPKGGKFYVVATLKANAASMTSNQVFKQDYTTTAKLTLTSLAKAYNTIPDLRTPKLELGFSVDLTWQAGNVYTINFD